MTNQIVLAVFEFLVQAELRKKIAKLHDNQFGWQEGGIQMLSILFGTASDADAQRGYESGETWIQITGDIIGEHLTCWDKLLSESENHLALDWKTFESDVKKAVEDFAIAHPERMVNALKKTI